MPLPGSTPIFSIGERRFDWDDVKVAAAVWGDWQEIETEVRAGLACKSFLEADENEIEPEAIEAAAEAFREERNLISAEEMTRWLEDRGLDAEEWLEFVGRSLARRRCVGQSEQIVRDFPVDGAAVRGALDCEAICSGVAAAVAAKLAAVATVAADRGTLEASIPESESEEARRTRIERLASTFEELRAEAIGAEAMARVLELHRLDWTLLECRVASFADEDAAREAALCVSEEREDLAKVAGDAGTRVEETTLLLRDVGEELEAKLLSAPQGELVGPFPFRGRATLLIVVAKTPPDESHPRIRPLAEQALVAAAIERNTRATPFHLEL